MNTDKGLVEKLGTLARIRVPAEKAVAFEAEFESIIAYIGQLDALTLPVDGAPATPVLRNVTRADDAVTPPGTWTERLVHAFPKKRGNALSVKKILSHD